jgi:hypothetical protein
VCFFEKTTFLKIFSGKLGNLGPFWGFEEVNGEGNIVPFRTPRWLRYKPIEQFWAKMKRFIDEETKTLRSLF